MKNNTLILLLLFFVFITLVLSSWPRRWVLVHGWSAANYAERLLAASAPERKFIDYTIYTSAGCVVFVLNEEDEDRAMVYCPHGVPGDTSQIGSLVHVLGPWYRSK